MGEMEERKAVNRVIGRMYKNYERSTGRIPDGKTVRAMEERAKDTARLVDNKKKRR